MSVRVKMRLVLADGLLLDFDREHDSFVFQLDDLVIEAMGGHLTVRQSSQALNLTPILRIPLR